LSFKKGDLSLSSGWPMMGGEITHTYLKHKTLSFIFRRGNIALVSVRGDRDSHALLSFLSLFSFMILIFICTCSIFRFFFFDSAHVYFKHFLLLIVVGCVYNCVHEYELK
jgi:hypothetical protein